MAEQFDERDQAFINDSIRSTHVPYGENVILLRQTGVLSSGDPAQGIQSQYQYAKLTVKAIISGLSQQDILSSGGIYQVGDIRVSLTQQLNYIDTIQQIGGQSQGDQLVYQGHKYRIVGKVADDVLIGQDKVFQYVFRKVGNANV